MRSRTPRNESIRRVRQHARDGATVPLLGGFRRSGKVVEVRIDDDQAADLIASLSGATGAERIEILSQLARAGIFEAIQTTVAEGASPEYSPPVLARSEAAPTDPTPSAASPAANPPSVPQPPALGDLPAGGVVALSAAPPAYLPSHPVRAEVRSGSPLGVEPATGPVPAHATDTTTSVGAEGALRSETCSCGHASHEHVERRGRRECTVCTCNGENIPISTGRPAASEQSGSLSVVSPRAEPVEPTSTQTSVGAEGALRPFRVRVPSLVPSDNPRWFPGAFVEAGEYEAYWNKYRAVSVVTARGEIGLKPDEFVWVGEQPQPIAHETCKACSGTGLADDETRLNADDEDDATCPTCRGEASWGIYEPRRYTGAASDTAREAQAPAVSNAPTSTAATAVAERARSASGQNAAAHYPSAPNGVDSGTSTPPGSAAAAPPGPVPGTTALARAEGAGSGVVRPLCGGWARTGRVVEPLTDFEAADWVAQLQDGPVARAAAVERLSLAGILPRLPGDATPEIAPSKRATPQELIAVERARFDADKAAGKYEREEAAPAPISRRDYLGSADIGMVVGASTFGGPWHVWAHKCEDLPEDESEILRVGLELEEGIARLWAWKSGATILRKGSLVLHPDDPTMGATVDFWVRSFDGQSGILECKNVGPGGRANWTDDDGDAIPQSVVAQTTWQAGICLAAGERVDFIAIARLEFGCRVKSAWIDYDPELFDELFAAGRAFWSAHVVTRTPPPLDGSSAATEHLGRRHPKGNGVWLEATTERAALVRALKDAKAATKEAERAEEEAKQRVLVAIGDADGIDGAAAWSLEAGRPSWKNIAEAVAKGAMLGKDLIGAHTGKGSRSLRLLGGK